MGENASAGALTRSRRTFKLPDFSTALGFVVRVGMAAEKRDHHPDIELGWGRAKIVWTTHDQKGVTSLDTELAPKRLRHSPSPEMNDASAREALEARLRRRIVALGRRSRASARRSRTQLRERDRRPDNQRLEFLGDAVLGLCVSEIL